MQPQKFGAPHPELHTVMERPASAAVTRGVLEGGTKLGSHQFGFVGVIQIQVGQFTQVSTGIPDQVEASENGREFVKVHVFPGSEWFCSL